MVKSLMMNHSGDLSRIKIWGYFLSLVSKITKHYEVGRSFILKRLLNKLLRKKIPREILSWIEIQG